MTARWWTRCGAAAAVLAVGTQCAAPAPAPAPEPTPASTAPTTAATPAAPAPATVGGVRRPATVHPVTAADLGPAWRPGCPVGPDGLRRVELDHLGMDARIHRGSLVVDAGLVDEVIAIFDELLRLGYPIERMRTVDHYPDASDEASMADNNTSAYNCRDIPGTGQWSWHAWGRAIDLNPLLNPYLDEHGVAPHNAGPYLDRNRIDPGLLHDGDAAVRVFTDRGWRWGGHWRNPVDYQHFERHR